MKKKTPLLLVASMFAASAGAIARGNAFNTGDLVVLQVGDGPGTTLAGGSGAGSLLDVSTSGSVGAPIAVPSTGTNELTFSTNVGDHAGLLELSGNGQYVSFGGYADAADDANDPAASTTINRVAGEVSFSGSVDTSTVIPTSLAYNGLALRAVTTNDGQEYWAAGQGTSGTYGSDGIRYLSPQAFDTTATSSNSADLGLKTVSGSTPGYADIRSVSIYGGKLYCTSGSGSSVGKGAFQVGTGGLPTSGPNTLVNIDGSTTISFNDVFLCNENGGTGFDTLYGTTTTNGIVKCTYFNGAWSVTAMDTTPANGEQLAVSVSGTGNSAVASIYYTGASGLYLLTDSAGYHSATNFSGLGNGTILAQPVSGDEFLGVAFAPTPEPTSAGVLLVASALLTRRRSVTQAKRID